MVITDVPPWPVYGPTVGADLQQLVESGEVYDYAGKAPVTLLEEQFAQLHEGRFVVSFNSGTSALFAGLCAVGVAEGDEVVVPNLTFLASASPALWLGATPVFADSSPDDPSVSPSAIERALSPRTRAVVVTHLFGNPVDIVTIADLCARRGIKLIEDCSHAHASTVQDRHVGTFGDVAIYSIGAGKIVSGGHGGLLVTPDPVVRDLALMIGHFKPRTRTDVLTEDLRKYAEFALGGNLRLSPVAALLALDHLNRLPEVSRARCANIAVLDRHLEEYLLPVRSSGPRHNRSHFDVVYALPAGAEPGRRDLLIDGLVAAGIPASAPSTRPLNRVLRAISLNDSNSENLLVRRLDSVAAAALADEDLPHSTCLHDRMVSFPASRLYLHDTSAAEVLGEAAAAVVSRVMGARS